MYIVTEKCTANAPGERLTCVLPVHVIRFLCVIGRRLRFVDEISDPFLAESVDGLDASQQSHTLERRYRKFSETLAPENRPSKAPTQLYNAFTPAKDALKESHLPLLLSSKGYTALQ